MDRPETSRNPTSEQSVLPKDASLAETPISLLRRDAKGTRPARIIWLDDDENIVEVLSYVFAEHLKDYNLVPCLNGDEALREIDRHPPDLLLTDYLHPGASLEAILHHLSARPARFPILLMSGCEKPEDLKRQFSSFTFTIELLSKPFVFWDLIAGIIRHLNSPNALPTHENLVAVRAPSRAEGRHGGRGGYSPKPKVGGGGGWVYSRNGY